MLTSANTPSPDTSRFPDHVPIITGFSFERALDRGGMGCVWLFRRDRDQRRFAVKTPHQHPALIARFAREIELNYRLNHPNVIRIVGTSDTFDWPWYMTPYYPRGTLRERVQRGPLDVDQIVKGILGLVRGLRHAHERDIVHGDIKPANVLMRSPRRWLLADWGLAHVVGEGSGLTEFGPVPGTHGYMAPEQEVGLPARVGKEADVYAIGRVLDTVVRGWGRPVPAALAAVVRRCLAGPAEHRYPDAGALEQALRRFAVG